MSERDPLHHCEQCGKPIHIGDLACVFYSDVWFCSDHAVKRSDEISYCRDALASDDWTAWFDGYSFADRTAFEAHIAKLEAALIGTGDGPAMVVTA